MGSDSQIGLRRTDEMESDSQIGFVAPTEWNLSPRLDFVAPTDTNSEVSPAFRSSRNNRADSKREVLLYRGVPKMLERTVLFPNSFLTLAYTLYHKGAFSCCDQRSFMHLFIPTDDLRFYKGRL